MKLISQKGFDFICGKDYIFFIARTGSGKDEFFKTDLEKVLEISHSEYADIKFSKAGRAVNSPYTECIRLDNGEYLTCLFSETKIFKHDRKGNKIKELSIGKYTTGFDIIYSIALDKNGKLWIAQPMSHYVGQFDLEDERELFRIGGDFENPGIFDHPEQVRAIDDFIFVCDMGNKRVCKINIETNEVSEYLKFEEHTWEYNRFKNKEIVKLTSGIYEL
ncbi:MAG: hypothetical protein ABI863_20320 [Ginsengibacter sp.]